MSNVALVNANSLRIPLADNTVHCVVTSPPYFGLRQYSGTVVWIGGDPDCDHQKPFVPRGERPGGKPKGKRTPQDFGSATNDAQSLAQAQYRDTCGKCGATRKDDQLGIEKTH